MAKGNQTLIILTPGFAKNEEDSTCLPAQQLLVKALNKIYPGLSIIILAFEYPFSRSPYIWNQNRVIPFDGWKKGRINKIRTWFRIRLRLRRLQKENNITGILSFWVGECAWIGKYFGKRHHIRHFSWILGQDARAGNKFIRCMSPRPEELIALSDFLARQFHSNHAVKPKHIIPNGIDSLLFNRRDHDRDIDVLGVGSLIPLKRYDIFIEMIAALKQHFPQIKACICGKGPEHDSLHSLIEESHLETNVSLLGERPHSEILELMQRSKILLHPSSYEGFSTVCLEALYAGAHVISFCNPMMEWVRHWRIASDRKDMLELLEDSLADGDADHRPVLPYSIDDSAKAVMKLFDYDGVAIS